LDNKIFILIVLILVLWLYKKLSTKDKPSISGINEKDQDKIKKERGLTA